MLNLINNAFYAVNEKRKVEHTDYEQPSKLLPVDRKIRCSLLFSDNGNGIPKNIVDKIFQPFFTTKPTGAEPAWV